MVSPWVRVHSRFVSIAQHARLNFTIGHRTYIQQKISIISRGLHQVLHEVLQLLLWLSRKSKAPTVVNGFTGFTRQVTDFCSGAKPVVLLPGKSFQTFESLRLRKASGGGYYPPWPLAAASESYHRFFATAIQHPSYPHMPSNQIPPIGP